MSVFFYFDEQEGSYNFTSTGFLVLAVIIAVIFLLGVSVLTAGKRLSARQIAFCAMAMALGAVTSNIKLMHMPMGGSVTLLSMLFITLIGNWYGLGTGLCCAVAYGFLQILMGPYIISFPQAITDYILAFGALGLSGIFHKNRRQGLVIGYVFAVLCRLFFSVLSGCMFFAEWTPEEFSSPFIYSLAYNGSYMGLELLLTVIIISLPPVSKALGSVKKLALMDKKQNENG